MSRNPSVHPLARPADRLLFAPTRDRYGVRLALVFGNHAPGGQCPYYAAGTVSPLRYRGGRRRRVHFGIESSTAGMVSGALPPGLAGSGASCPLQLRVASQPHRKCPPICSTKSSFGAIAAGLAYCFSGNTGEYRNRTLGAPRGGCVRSQQDGASDTGPGDIR